MACSKRLGLSEEHVLNGTLILETSVIDSWEASWHLLASGEVLFDSVRNNPNPSPLAWQRANFRPRAKIEKSSRKLGFARPEQIGEN